ncbi:Nramp family divalent metal transporter [Flavihumibacter sp. UBA7668]|uniref:Nramp family divalent metal transporter n=1 Tax=Flavihumibacter sp. UBA7668 TaxID=1946542 RepID=UPI0025C4C9AD|nr:Nramp family divalent metal transporter [Flavihumibacter sp. UBA7668]
MYAIRNWLSRLGPGIITAALVFGPSKMTITSRLGAEYGYRLTWIIVVAIFFMISFTNMGARIGATASASLLTLIRQKWGGVVSIAIGAGIFLVTASFQAGNAIGLGISLGESTHTKPNNWILLFTALSISLLFFRSFYSVLEKLMMALVGLMLFAFGSTLFMAKPSASSILGGLVPSLPDGSIGLVIAFIASCFSIVGAVYQSYLERERRRIHPGGAGKSSGTTGILILGVMSAVVLICAASVLHPQQIKVTNAAGMAKALEPLYGEYASVLFYLGLFGASFSSLVGNATVGGSLLGDALGWGDGFRDTKVKWLIAAVMVTGATVAILFGKLPLEMIVLAQSITIFLVPFIGFALLAIANDRSIMGDQVNSQSQRIIGFLGLLLVTSLAVFNFYELFLK